MKSIGIIGFLVVALCHRQVVSFAIKTHFESESADQNSNNDTLVFAHVVSNIVKNLILKKFCAKYYIYFFRINTENRYIGTETVP